MCRHRVSIVIALATLSFLSLGCQNLSRHIRSYNGPPLATNQIALLKVQSSISGVMLSVDKIDQQPVKRFFANEIELLPGLHGLEVYYRDSSGAHSITDAKISFFAEAGLVYELRAEPVEMTLGQEIKKSLVPFSRWRFTLWIVEAGTGKVISGTQRETPLHWYE